MGIKQQQVDTTFKLRHENKLNEDLNRVYNLIIYDAVKYYSQNKTYKNLDDYNTLISSILYTNWVEIRNRFIRVINNMMVNTNTFNKLNNIADNSFNNIGIKDLLIDIRNNAIQNNSINMYNTVTQSTSSIAKTNNKQIISAAALGLSAVDFKNKISDLYRNRIPTISTTFVQSASEKTKSDYTNSINSKLKENNKDDDLTKSWAAVLDDHTRESHVIADGQTVPIEDYYIVDGELLYEPGDTRFSSIGNTINCRCSSLINF